MPIFHSFHAEIEVTLEKFIRSNTLQQFTYRNIKNVTADQLAEHLKGFVLDCASENPRKAIVKLAPLTTVTKKKAPLDRHGVATIG